MLSKQTTLSSDCWGLSLWGFYSKAKPVILLQFCMSEWEIGSKQIYSFIAASQPLCVIHTPLPAPLNLTFSWTHPLNFQWKKAKDYIKDKQFHNFTWHFKQSNHPKWYVTCDRKVVWFHLLSPTLPSFSEVLNSITCKLILGRRT